MIPKIYSSVPWLTGIDYSDNNNKVEYKERIKYLPKVSLNPKVNKIKCENVFNLLALALCLGISFGLGYIYALSNKKG